MPSLAPNKADILAAVEEVLTFAGVQGARTVTEWVEDVEGGRVRVRVRVVRGEGRRDFVYDVLVQPNGLLGIYKVS